MPPDVRDAALLHDMLNAARRVTTYATGPSRQDLDTDLMFADAVERRIEIIGEAARGLSDAYRDSHPEIPWRPIMATRHILAHDYDEVNHDTIWRIIQDHIPPLIRQLEAVLAQFPPPPTE
jgi:uncharacterized protein with HEPN domain